MTKRVTVVDDDDATRVAMTTLLTEAGYEVRALVDGIELIRIIETEEMDAILLDVDMPVFDGVRVVDYLDAMAPALLARTIVITGWPAIAARVASRVRRVLVKPIDTDALLEELRSCV
jgi:CheY-like chemotaxis protein